MGPAWLPGRCNQRSGRIRRVPEHDGRKRPGLAPGESHEWRDERDAMRKIPLRCWKFTELAAPVVWWSDVRCAPIQMLAD
jgi:hypothetical protein